MMPEPLVNFSDDVPAARRREILVERLATLEAELPDLEEVARKKDIAYKRAHTALSNAQARVDYNKEKQDRAAAQLRALLPEPSGWELMRMVGLVDRSNLKGQTADHD